MFLNTRIAITLKRLLEMKIGCITAQYCHYHEKAFYMVGISESWKTFLSTRFHLFPFPNIYYISLCTRNQTIISQFNLYKTVVSSENNKLRAYIGDPDVIRKMDENSHETSDGATAAEVIAGTGDQQDNLSVGKITVKPPTFYRSNPTVWFRQLESQFALARIQNTRTKFHHVMSALPEDVAINLSLTEEDYEAIKREICHIYQKSRQELLEEALGSVSLDGQKPSVCLIRIRRKLADCNLQVDDDVVRHRLLQAMPHATKIALSAHSALPLSEFAKLADTIYSYTQVSEYNVAAVDTKAKIPFRMEKDSNKTFSDCRPFSEGQRPKICRFHLFYAGKARRCKPWCKWPGQKPAIIDPTSRPNSPAPISEN